MFRRRDRGLADACRRGTLRNSACLLADELPLARRHRRRAPVGPLHRSLTFSSKEPDFAAKDFSSLKSQLNVDRLLVIDINALGALRTYSAYIPTSDPKAVLRGTGYIVNLSNNALDWYLPVNILKSAEQSWDEPPKFPGLTNAYFQAIEVGKDTFKQPFQQ